jgi:uncharacterized OsmC-like protein
VLTLSAVADHKKIAMEKLEVRVGCMTENGISQSTQFKIKIDLGDGLTQRERTILFNSARNCEVSKILKGKIDIGYEIRYGKLETIRHPGHDGGGKHGDG